MKIDTMHKLFRKREGNVCGSCSSFINVSSGSRTVHKCMVYGVSGSRSTDWNGKYPACGLFNTDSSLRNVYKWKRDDENVCDGQIEMTDM